MTHQMVVAQLVTAFASGALPTLAKLDSGCLRHLIPHDDGQPEPESLPDNTGLASVWLGHQHLGGAIVILTAAANSCRDHSKITKLLLFLGKLLVHLASHPFLTLSTKASHFGRPSLTATAIIYNAQSTVRHFHVGAKGGSHRLGVADVTPIAATYLDQAYVLTP